MGVYPDSLPVVGIKTCGSSSYKSLSQAPEISGSSSRESSGDIREILEFTDSQLPLISDLWEFLPRAFSMVSEICAWEIISEPASTEV